jgi:hypothetical protein
MAMKGYVKAPRGVEGSPDLTTKLFLCHHANSKRMAVMATFGVEPGPWGAPGGEHPYCGFSGVSPENVSGYVARKLALLRGEALPRVTRAEIAPRREDDSSGGSEAVEGPKRETEVAAWIEFTKQGPIRGQKDPAWLKPVVPKGLVDRLVVNNLGAAHPPSAAVLQPDTPSLTSSIAPSAAQNLANSVSVKDSGRFSINTGRGRISQTAERLRCALATAELEERKRRGDDAFLYDPIGMVAELMREHAPVRAMLSETHEDILRARRERAREPACSAREEEARAILAASRAAREAAQGSLPK